MPNIFHGCLQQDTSFINRTKSAQSEYSFLQSCLLISCFEIELSFGISGFFLVTCVSYFFPLSPFFLLCFNHQQEQTIENGISFWALQGVMLPKQPELTGGLELKALVSVINNPEY